MKKTVSAYEDLNDLRWIRASEAVKLINEAIERRGNGAIEIESDGNGSVSIFFVYDREETDKEYEARMASTARAEEIERRQYERLKAKYEGSKA